MYPGLELLELLLKENDKNGEVQQTENSNAKPGT